MQSKLKWALDQALIVLVAMLGLWLLVVRPIGYRLSLIPGIYGDTLLINYILEHFYRWIAGLDPSFWNAGLFFPFPLTLAFSDNLLGVGPFYAPLRWAGLDPQTALQAWLILGFILNYAAAAFVLRRLKFSPLASACGAFFFSFGLPMLMQVIHLQLLYRFCVPLAAYGVWRFAQEPDLARLAAVLLLLLWQALISIYLGVFLGLLLLAMALLLPLFDASVRERLAYWPVRLRAGWQAAGVLRRGLALAALFLLVGGLAALLWPYARVTELYGFNRGWSEVASMLPRPQSYLNANYVWYWQGVSRLLQDLPMRHEHQLFPGLAVLALLATGLVGRFDTPNRKLAFWSLASLLVLFVLTLDINGFSLYRLVWALPGMNSIRSVTRIVLVLMWPAAIFLAYSIDGLKQTIQRTRFGQAAVLALAGVVLAGLFFDALSFDNNLTFVKRHVQEQLEALHAKLPEQLPQDPILFVAVEGDKSEVYSEVNGMLLAQSLGWPTLNGYSGNAPPGYETAQSCLALPHRVEGYLQFVGSTDPAAYQALMQRIVPVGFHDCDPAWWQSAP